MYAIEFTYVFLAKNLILLLQSIRGTSSSNGILVTNDEYFFLLQMKIGTSTAIQKMMSNDKEVITMVTKYTQT